MLLDATTGSPLTGQAHIGILQHGSTMDAPKFKVSDTFARIAADEVSTMVEEKLARFMSGKDLDHRIASHREIVGRLGCFVLSPHAPGSTFVWDGRPVFHYVVSYQTNPPTITFTDYPA